MAKGNMFMQTARGKLGNLVLYNKSGQQITRAYQSVVKNPKSSGQMTQRAKFANAVKFYKRAVASFFKFAYQDKKTNESDYNAFMRYNINRSPVLPKGIVDDAAWPAIGPWVMSSGSLANLRQPTFSGSEVHFVNIFGDEISWPDYGFDDPSTLTIGNISSVLLENYPGTVAVNDIITLVAIASPANTLDFDFSNYTDGGIYDNPPTWWIGQFIVNPDDTTKASDMKYTQSGTLVEPGIDFSAHANVSFTLPNDKGSLFACAIHTRVTDGKTYASFTTLQLNDIAQSIIADAAIESNLQNALVTWGVGNDAILQGSIAGTRTSTASGAVIDTVNGGTTPATVNITAETGAAITVVGSNLSTLEPTVSGNVAIQSFTVNAARTQATFTVKPSDNGAYTVTYGGTVIVSGTVTLDNA